MYVAGFDRGVRPIGFWSMSITLSKTSIPSTEWWSPGFTRILFSRLARPCRRSRSRASTCPNRRRRHRHELPDRELDVDAFQVVHRRTADREVAQVVLAPRRDRDRPPAREELTGDGLLLSITSFAVPSATTQPPCSPAPGPMSTSQSAVRIICSSCSTTRTVLPDP
jgi:hypothetical protein